jgi:tetratricopeptide (TPR) repeat protein
MPMTTELESLLDEAELQVARRKRWSVLLILASIVLAMALVIVSVRMLREAGKRTEALERRAAVAIEEERTAKQELVALEQQVAAAHAALETTRRSAENLGITFFRQRRYPAAIKAYESALDVDPGNMYLVNLKGYAYFKMGDYSRAVATLEAGIRQDPSFTHLYVDLARAQCAAGDFTKASANARKGIQLSRDEYTAMAADGEFIRLCRPIIRDLGLPQVPRE